MKLNGTMQDCRCPGEGPAIGDGLGRTLDTLVASAHGLRAFGRPYHPYHAATDAGTVAILAFSGWFTTVQPDVGFFRFVAAFAGTQALYMLCRHLRHRATGAATRSFLQDSVLIILPSFAGLSLLFGNSLPASLDLAGFGVGLGLAFIRVGCFLGGCCYGRPALWGVLYTPKTLVDARGCRSFTCSPVPAGRVIPIQLFEAAVSVTLVAMLLAWWLHVPGAHGCVLPAYLFGYAVWRFTGDFWRTVSARPRRAGLSEAQLFSAVVGVSCGLLIVLRSHTSLG